MYPSKHTRRNFLAATAAVASSELLRGQATGSELRVAFIGIGTRGSFLLQNMLKVPGVKVVAVCDILPERLAKAAETVKAAGQSARSWGDFRRMLDQQKEIDAVVLATPDWTHKDFDIAILEMGKHLYAEKPLALTADDCRAVAREAVRAKGIFQVGFQLRHDPNRNAAMRFIQGGGIGKVLMCHGIRHGRDLPRDRAWYFDRKKSGDILVDQGIHILDLFTWAIGTHPDRALAYGGTHLFVNDPPGRTVMDNYSLIFEYAGGQHTNFSHQYFDPPGFTGIQERVFGTEGAIDLQAAAWQPREKRGLVKLDVPNAGKDAAYMSLAAFAENVRNNNRKPLNNAQSAMESTLQALMATEAIYRKRPVTWKEIAG